MKAEKISLIKRFLNTSIVFGIFVSFFSATLAGYFATKEQVRIIPTDSIKSADSIKSKDLTYYMAKNDSLSKLFYLDSLIHSQSIKTYNQQISYEKLLIRPKYSFMSADSLRKIRFDSLLKKLEMQQTYLTLISLKRDSLIYSLKVDLSLYNFQVRQIDSIQKQLTPQTVYFCSNTDSTKVLLAALTLVRSGKPVNDIQLLNDRCQNEKANIYYYDMGSPKKEYNKSVLDSIYRIWNTK